MGRRVRSAAVVASLVASAIGCGTLVVTPGTGRDNDGTIAQDDAATDAATSGDALGSGDGRTSDAGVCPRRCTGTPYKPDSFDTLDDWPRSGPATLDTVDFLSPPASMEIDATGTYSTVVMGSGFSASAMCAEMCFELTQSGTFGGNGDVMLLAVTGPSPEGGTVSTLSLHAGATDRIVAGAATTPTTLPRSRWFHVRLELDIAAAIASVYLDDALVVASAPVPVSPVSVTMSVGAVPTGALPPGFIVHVDDILATQK